MEKINKKRLTWIIPLTICSHLIVADPDFTISAQDLANGLTISQPGVWQLQENASVTVNTAITISSSQVTLDLNGHEIDGQGNSDIGILIDNAQEVTINNGSLNNFSTTSIKCDAATDANIESVTSKNSGSALTIVNSTRVFAKDCFADESSYASFSAHQSESIVFSSCRSRRAGQEGFLIDNQTSNILFDSCGVASSQTTAYLIEGSNYILQSSWSQKAAGNGMYLGGNNGQLINLCGAFEGSQNGILVSGTNISIENTNSINNSQNGIYANAAASQVTISSSRILNNTGYGIVAASIFSTTASNNEVKNNTAGNYHKVVVK